MNEQTRLLFLARHYTDLQGLSLMPLWVGGLVLSLIRHPQGHPVEAMASFGLIVIVQIAWLRGTGRYYREHFGWLRVNPVPPRRPGLRTRLLLYLLSFPLVCSILYFWKTGSMAWASKMFTIAVIFLADLMIQRMMDRENPRVRRTCYGIGASLIILAEVLNLLARCDLRIVLATISVTMLSLGIADHLLLLRLLPRPAEEIRA